MEASVATAAGQGAPTPAAQPAAAGQGQGAGPPTAGSNGDAQFNWGLFPDVPEDQRQALEPHLKNVQGHVTRMEQQYAPYQPLTSILGGDQVENMVGFLNAYNSDPTATVLGMVRQAMEDGSLTAEQIGELAKDQQVPAPGQQQAQPGQEEIPAWAREMQGRFAQMDQALEAQKAQEAEAESAQILDQAKTGIRGQLTAGGIPENIIGDEMIVASIIAHNGDEAAAAQSLLQLRQNLLGDFTQKPTPASGKQPTQQGKLPQAPKKGGGRRDPDGFGQAKLGAEQFLRQQVAGASG